MRSHFQRRRHAGCVMVLGTTSGAGKSWVDTALCSHYASQGLKVAPFKAQNMSNNARVVAGLPTSPAGGGQGWGQATLAAGAAGPSPQRGEGATADALTVDSLPLPHAGEGWGEGATPLGEIGSAQYFQALAARAVPDVRMNPLLLKPEADTHSQVLLLGQVNRELTDLPWRRKRTA